MKYPSPVSFIVSQTLWQPKTPFRASLNVSDYRLIAMNHKNVFLSSGIEYHAGAGGGGGIGR